MRPSDYDFCGWATKNDIRCSDGRVIKRNAFIECDGTTVPLVWNHDHSNPENVLGHAYLENRPDGVYCYGSFNNTPLGKDAKEMLRHGDITNLSIYANRLQHSGRDVIHGLIREVSLVLAGANPGASIDYVLAHSDNLFADDNEEGVVYTDEPIELYHSEDYDEEGSSMNYEDEEYVEDDEYLDDEYEDEYDEDEYDEDYDDDESFEHAEGVSPVDIFNAMTEEQQEAVYTIVGAAVQEAMNGNLDDIQEDNEDMKHNVFTDDYEYGEDYIAHADVEAIFSDLPRYGSLKESCLQHGITDIDVMFPDAKTIANEPSLISRDMDWVDKVLNATHHTPFSRVKSIHANITADEARARGYIKGHKKVEEVIKALKRVTTPQTIYKLQKLDRDDIIDITDFNVVAFLKAEMRVMLNEELARAILIGDGRSDTSEDKIQETNIRPIWKDDDTYTVSRTVVKDSKYVKNFIKECVKSRKEYKGSGNPVLFTTEDLLTDMLLLEDGIGRPLYDTIEKLKTALRVSDIITVPVMEGATREVKGVTRELGGIYVNLKDYNVGANNGGAVSMFDDFDLDYNKEKYLIETRCSGALTVPYSAVAIEFVEPEGATESETEPEDTTQG